MPVYENGRVLKTYTLDEVRANASKALEERRLDARTATAMPQRECTRSS